MKGLEPSTFCMASSWWSVSKCRFPAANGTVLLASTRAYDACKLRRIRGGSRNESGTGGPRPAEPRRAACRADAVATDARAPAAAHTRAGRDGSSRRRWFEPSIAIAQLRKPRCGAASVVSGADRATNALPISGRGRPFARARCAHGCRHFRASQRTSVQGRQLVRRLRMPCGRALRPPPASEGRRDVARSGPTARTALTRLLWLGGDARAVGGRAASRR